MKKGVGFGRVILNGIVFTLVFLIALGAISIGYDFVTKNSEDTQLESIETTASESNAMTPIPDL